MRTDDAALVTYVDPSLAVPDEDGEPEETAVFDLANIAGNVYSPLSKKLALSNPYGAPATVAAKNVRIFIPELSLEAASGVRRPLIINVDDVFARIGLVPPANTNVA
jgi:hypothetical protein